MSSKLTVIKKNETTAGEIQKTLIQTATDKINANKPEYLKTANNVAIAIERLGCVRRDSEVIVAKKIYYKEKEYNLTFSENFYDEKTIADMVASFASNYGFEITIKGKTYSKNFVSTLIYDYIKLSESYCRDVKQIRSDKDKSENYKNLKIVYLKEKFYDILSNYYGIDKKVVEHIIYEYSKKKKGIPFGFKHKFYYNDNEKYDNNSLIFEGNGFYVLIDSKTFAIEKIKKFKKQEKFNKNDFIEILLKRYNEEIGTIDIPLIEDKNKIMEEFEEYLNMTDYSKNNIFRKELCEVLDAVLDILIPLRDMNLLWTPSGTKVKFLTWNIISEWFWDIKLLNNLNFIIENSNESETMIDVYDVFAEEHKQQYKKIDNGKLKKFLKENKSDYRNIVLPFLEAIEKMKNRAVNLEIKTEIALIGSIKPGNFVLSYDNKRDRAVFKKVLGVYDIDVKPKDQIEITLNTGERIITSKWHPFPVEKNGIFMYIRSDEVKAGDTTFKIHFMRAKNASVSSARELMPNETFSEFKDLTVEDTNNYFCRIQTDVLNDFALIHNTKKGLLDCGQDRSFFGFIN